METNLNKRLPVGDLDLYQLLSQITETASTRTEQSASRQSYSGIDHFLDHAKQVLNQYRIENNKVIHTTQAASAAMIEAIQLMRLPPEKWTAAVSDRLQSCTRLVAKYGQEEQKKIFLDSLKAQLSQQTDLFVSLMNNYQDSITAEFPPQSPPETSSGISNSVSMYT